MNFQKEFYKAITEFNKDEKRAPFYEWARDLIKSERKEYKLGGAVLLLATWNFAYFRYAVTDFNTTCFEKVVSEIEKWSRKHENLSLESDLEESKKEIIKMFDYVANTPILQERSSPKINVKNHCTAR